MVEAEAPMRTAAFGRWLAFGLALINRRKTAPEQDLPPNFELFGRLVAGIDSAGRFQPLKLAFVEGEALGLAHHDVRPES
jgi:hypothetical protein